MSSKRLSRESLKNFEQPILSWDEREISDNRRNILYLFLYFQVHARANVKFPEMCDFVMLSFSKRFDIIEKF